MYRSYLVCMYIATGKSKKQWHLLPNKYIYTFISVVVFQNNHLLLGNICTCHAAVIFTAIIYVHMHAYEILFLKCTQEIIYKINLDLAF